MAVSAREKKKGRLDRLGWGWVGKDFAVVIRGAFLITLHLCKDSRGVRERAPGIPGKGLEAVQRPCAGMWEVQGALGSAAGAESWRRTRGGGLRAGGRQVAEACRLQGC